MVAASLVHSRIDYANSLVHGSTNIKKLQRLQNIAARIVLPHLSKLPSTSLLRELHWLPVHSRIIYKLACLTYNSLITGQPGYLRSLINYYTPTRTLRSTNQLILDCPRFSTEFGKRSFSYIAPTVWNDLPLDTRLSPTADTFKCRLKTVSRLLRDLNWLQVPERIKFRLAVLVFHCLNRTAPAYLTRDLQWATDDDSRKHLRSASSHKFINLWDDADRSTAISIYNGWWLRFGRRCTLFAEWPACNVISAPSLSVFNKRLKTHLFRQSFCL